MRWIGTGGAFGCWDCEWVGGTLLRPCGLPDPMVDSNGLRVDGGERLIGSCGITSPLSGLFFRTRASASQGLAGIAEVVGEISDG